MVVDNDNLLAVNVQTESTREVALRLVRDVLMAQDGKLAEDADAARSAYLERVAIFVLGIY